MRYVALQGSALLLGQCPCNMAKPIPPRSQTIIGQHRGDQHLLDISCEQLGVDCSVEHIRSDYAVFAQAADEAQRLAVAMRDSGDETLANGRPAVSARHVGLDRRLVEKDQTPWFEAGLAEAPLRTGLRDIGTLLFGGMQRFFLCVKPSLRSVPCISALLALT